MKKDDEVWRRTSTKDDNEANVGVDLMYSDEGGGSTHAQRVEGRQRKEEDECWQTEYTAVNASS